MNMNIQKMAYEAVDAYKSEMLNLWAELINCDCGSMNKVGVDAVNAKIGSFLSALGFKTRQVPFEKAGNMLIAEYGDTTKPFVVLTGHMDTVFKNGTAAERPFTIKDGKAYGPGVLDMKGGIVIFLYALKALLANGYDRYPIKVILAGDEEVGHRDSNAAEIFEREAKGALAAFNFETGFLDNGVVVQRKGTWQFSMEVTGRGAHVGNDPENGRSAIAEICRKVIDIEALTDFKAGYNLNVGRIEGGTVPNAVPEHAKIICDLRFEKAADLLDLQAKLQTIANKVYIEGTHTTLTSLTNFKSMDKSEATMELFNKVNKLAVENGFAPMTPKFVGGGSDSAYMVAAGVPTLCAMGVQGARNHTVDEFAVVDSLFTRCKLMITILCNL